MTAGVDNNCSSRQQSTQDQVTDYNVEGTMLASNAIESGVAMMAVTVEDGGSRHQRRWRTATVADDNGG